MNVIGVPVEFLDKLAKGLGIHLQVQRVDDDGEVRCRLWPETGSNQWRAQTLTGRMKPSLCFHVQHYWMCQVFVHYPEAIIQTYYTRWNRVLFDAGAIPWTKNEIASRARSQTCDCSPALVEMTLVVPSELNERGERIVNGRPKRATKDRGRRGSGRSNQTKVG